jgi:hypothetical protein
MRLCALWDIGFDMNLGKISAKFLRGNAVAENLARYQFNISILQANCSKTEPAWLSGSAQTRKLIF